MEVSDTPGLSWRSELGDHAYWGMLAVCSLYALYATPLWLHAISALAVVLGAFYVLRILQRLGMGGALASAGALAFVLDDNTARTLNYGFHPEILYAWFVPLMVDAGLRGARRSFLAAVLASVLVKQVRAFGIYYAILLVPFLAVGAASGALALARWLTSEPGKATLASASALLLGVLLVGSGIRGYSLRPWKPEIAAVPEALDRLGGERLVLVQSGLFPHAGYDPRFQLLTPKTLNDPAHAGAAVLLAGQVGAYPFRAGDLSRLSALPATGPMPPGLVSVRLSAPPGIEPSRRHRRRARTGCSGPVHRFRPCSTLTVGPSLSLRHGTLLLPRPERVRREVLRWRPARTGWTP